MVVSWWFTSTLFLLFKSSPSSLWSSSSSSSSSSSLLLSGFLSQLHHHHYHPHHRHHHGLVVAFIIIIITFIMITSISGITGHIIEIGHVIFGSCVNLLIMSSLYIFLDVISALTCHMADNYTYLYWCWKRTKSLRLFCNHKAPFTFLPYWFLINGALLVDNAILSELDQSAEPVRKLEADSFRSRRADPVRDIRM